MLPTRQETLTGAVVPGMDTHLNVHVAVALDRVGRRLAARKHPTGYNAHAEASPWTSYRTRFGPVSSNLSM